MMPFEKYPDPDMLDQLRRSNENAALAREERMRQADEQKRHLHWVLVDTAKQTLGIAEMIHAQPGEEWAVENVRIGLQVLIEKLEKLPHEVL